MPEYLAPGVFVEEVSYRAKSIEGVSTTTTGFVGATRYGPTDIEPEIVTSLVDYERVYGGRQPLVFGTDRVDNYMWNAARAFFEEGGKRLYVVRAFSGDQDAARARVADASKPGEIDVEARFPGTAGQARISLRFVASQNRLAFADGDAGAAKLASSGHRDVVSVRGLTVGGDVMNGLFLILYDALTGDWTFDDANGNTPSFVLSDAAKTDNAAATVQTITATVFIEPQVEGLPFFAAAGLALDPEHRTGGRPDSLSSYFAEDHSSPSASRAIPIIFSVDDTLNGLQLLRLFVDDADPTPVNRFPMAKLTDVADPAETDLILDARFTLTGGSDGTAPDMAAFEGEEDSTTNRKSGLKAFEDMEDISIVAAPGSSFNDETDAQAIANLLISHASRMRYRIAVIDSIRGQSIAETRNYRAKFDSSYAAFYYPWVKIIDPESGQENHYPPSGFVSGIYARNDVNRAVYKAPANEVVNLALGFEKMLNKAQQEVLNPEGVNCFRYFEGRGMRLWGARTMSSDPEWKYVNLRRYFAYLERSIDKGTQWAVFEPNGERLWANVKRTIDDFLLNEWQNGALLGDKPEKSYFVKCDRSTMSQNDLDNGRLVCQVGVAALRPAEFVIFRVGQWTADRKS